MRISDWSSDVCSSDLAFDSLAACKRHDENGSPLLARTAGPAGTVLQCFSVARNVGVNDEAQIGQINTARCHVRRPAYTRTAVPQSLHGMIALILAMLARKRDSIEPAPNKEIGRAHV